MFSETNAAQAKLTHIGARPAGFIAAVLPPSGRTVTRQLVQAFAVAQTLELGALGAVAADHFLTLQIAGNARLFSHVTLLLSQRARQTFEAGLCHALFVGI